MRLEPFSRPHRMIFKDGDLYKGWTDSDCYESEDAMRWKRKARLEPGDGVQDGLYQVFIDPTGPPDERFKAVWTGEIDRTQFEAFRAQRPEGWEPRALLHLVELPGGDWALPYIANDVPHKYPRGRRTSGASYAVWPKGRMIAVAKASSR